MKWISIFLLLLCHSRYKFFFSPAESAQIRWNYIHKVKFFFSLIQRELLLLLLYLYFALFSEMILNYFFRVFWFLFFFYSHFFTFIRSFSPHNNDEKRAECVTWRMHLNWDIIVPHLKGISWFRYYYCCSANKYKYRKKVCVCIVKNKWL